MAELFRLQWHGKFAL